MKKKCKWCPNMIPYSRKANSDYCSDDCYYEAKKHRSKQRYLQNKAFFDLVKRNEDILSKLYFLSGLQKDWSFNDLEKLKFDFGISTGELAGKNSEIWTVVAGYAYYIDPKTKIAHIWKRPSK